MQRRESINTTLTVSVCGMVTDNEAAALKAQQKAWINTTLVHQFV